MIDRLAGELDRLPKASSYTADESLVFGHPHTGNPLDRSKLLQRFKAAVTRAKVGLFRDSAKPDGTAELRPLTRFHDLRHTFGTQMAAQGAPMRTLQELMGHNEFKTTLIYADYSPTAQEADWAEGVRAARQPSGAHCDGIRECDRRNRQRADQ
jgi:integrase